MKNVPHSVIKKLCSNSRQEVEDSFNYIFQKYANLVYYVAFDFLKNEEESKDIVNETFLKMYEKRNELANGSNLKYYLLTTAKNTAINRIKKENDHLSFDEEMVGQEDQGHLSLYLDKFKDLLDKEEFDYLVLHILYEYTFKEIAKSYHLTTAQVSSKYQRGLKKLKDYYGGQKDE